MLVEFAQGSEPQKKLAIAVNKQGADHFNYRINFWEPMGKIREQLLTEMVSDLMIMMLQLKLMEEKGAKPDSWGIIGGTLRVPYVVRSYDGQRVTHYHLLGWRDYDDFKLKAVIQDKTKEGSLLSFLHKVGAEKTLTWVTETLQPTLTQCSSVKNFMQIQSSEDKRISSKTVEEVSSQKQSVSISANINTTFHQKGNSQTDNETIENLKECGITGVIKVEKEETQEDITAIYFDDEENVECQCELLRALLESLSINTDNISLSSERKVIFLPTNALNSFLNPVRIKLDVD